jgi:hypothetical protein
LRTALTVRIASSAGVPCSTSSRAAPRRTDAGSAEPALAVQDDPFASRESGAQVAPALSQRRSHVSSGVETSGIGK